MLLHTFDLLLQSKRATIRCLTSCIVQETGTYFFLTRPHKGRNVTLNFLMTANPRFSTVGYTEPCNHNYRPRPHAISGCILYALLKSHHNCDAYMYVQKERKSTFFTALEHREKEARSIFAAQYWYRSCLRMSLSCESSVCSTILKYFWYLVQFAKYIWLILFVHFFDLQLDRYDIVQKVQNNLV